MAYNIIYQDVNIVCTNMTSGVPQQIGCEPQPRFEIMQEGTSPMLTCRDCKISSSFICKLPQSMSAGLLSFLAGVVIVVAVLALVVFTGGVGAAAVGAFMLGAASTTAATSMLIGAAVVAGTTVFAASLTYGYQSKHDCDVVLGMSWSIYHQSILVQGQHAIIDQSILECPRGGLITLIMDKGIAQEAASMISASNKEQKWEEVESQFFQGLIGGLTGGANPVSLTISCICYMINWWSKKSHHAEIYQDLDYEESSVVDTTGKVIDTGHELYETGKDDLAARQTIKKAQANAVAQDKGAARLNEKAAQSGTKASIKHANIQQGVAEKANAAVEKAKINRWTKLARGLGQVGLGLAGGLLSGKVADCYNKKETDMEVDVLRQLSQEIRKDRETAGKVISYEI